MRMIEGDAIMLKRIMLWLGVVAVLIGMGAAIGWYYARPAPVVETAAPAVTQQDGSTLAARAPDAHAKPKQKVPRGAKVERVAEIEVQGQGLKIGGEVKPCPPVTIDTTLIRQDDGSKRLIVSSSDGQINRAVDIPVETAAPTPEPPKWAAGLSIDPAHQSFGAWMERDLSRFRVGVEINQRNVSSPFGRAEARIRLGITF